MLGGYLTPPRTFTLIHGVKCRFVEFGELIFENIKLHSGRRVWGARSACKNGIKFYQT